jgi:hypothetical protein
MSTNPSEDATQGKKKITRRDFLKLSGAIGAVTAISSFVIPFGKVAGANNTNINHAGNTNTIMNKGTLSSSSSSTHFFDLDGAKSQFYNPTGSRTIINADNFPILSGMAAALVSLQKGAVREPHWHPNAAELSYCIAGNANLQQCLHCL